MDLWASEPEGFEGERMPMGVKKLPDYLRLDGIGAVFGGLQSCNAKLVQDHLLDLQQVEKGINPFHQELVQTFPIHTHFLTQGRADLVGINEAAEYLAG